MPRVSSKGQVTLPVDVRKRLGLRPGDSLSLTVEDGRLVGTKTTAPRPTVEELLAVGRGQPLPESFDDGPVGDEAI